MSSLGSSAISSSVRALGRLNTICCHGVATDLFKNVPQAPPDPILGVAQAFRADTSANKVNVGVGAYRDENGKPWTLPSVKAAENRIHARGMDHEYGPIEGEKSFVDASLALAYGADSEVITSGRVTGVQSLSGTGALRIAAGFLARFPPTSDGSRPDVYVPAPTWSNHFQIFEHSGFMVKEYKYWDGKTLGLNIDGMIEDLSKLSPRSIVLLHACAHNPTGVDPTPAEWARIERVCAERDLYVIFDSAYQGFASGSLEKDAYALRLFAEKKHNFILCQSFAKNFGLYGERVGCMSLIASNKEDASRLLSQIKLVARAMYSNPPIHGSRIVSEILNDQALNTQWRTDIVTMSSRIIKMRQRLVDELKKAGSTKDWSHITKQIGMFSFTGLNKDQCVRLTNEFHIYLTLNGRISMAGVTEHNVAYLASAMHAVSK